MNSGAPMLAIVIAFIVMAVVAVIAFTLTKLFVRTKKGFAFVKTGFGGEKVVLDGGAVILPILHEIVWICMKTRKIIVGRTGPNALITKDKFRVDVEAEFYLRVKQDSEAVSLATQSLGEGAMDDKILKELMEGKFVDALRAAGASMDMNQLHEEREKFVQTVQNNVQSELGKNGLELESVSLVSLDQTNIEHLDENNAFDAEGMTKLTKIIEDRKKIRNDIEQKNRIEIEQKNLETEKQSLEIKQDEEVARADQQKTIRVAQASADRESREAEITAERKVEEATIEKQKTVKQAEILKEKTIEIDTQQKNVEVYEKSQEESVAQAEANEKKAKAIAAEEKITTAQDTEVANREKAVAIIKAEEIAQESAVGIKVAAEADKDAAKNKAEAVLVEATAKADAVKLAADAHKEELLAEAKGTEEINKAQNMLSLDIVKMKVQLSGIENADKIVAAMMKPVEKIDGIKMINVTGLGGVGGAAGASGGNGGGGNTMQELFSGLMNYRAQMPFIQDILSSAGIDTSDPTKLVDSLANISDKKVDVPKDVDKGDILDALD
jgi:uncharacterized membrane protein YqiK